MNKTKCCSGAFTFKAFGYATALLVVGICVAPAVAADCVRDELIAKNDPTCCSSEFAETVTTKGHRVLRFSGPSEVAPTMSWQLTDALQICATDIAGLYAVSDASKPSGVAHGKLVSGRKP